LLRYLPLVLFTTASVIVAPAVLVAAFVPRGGSLLMVASTASAVAVSVAIASVEAALWTRRPGSRDLVFADLMLWGWVRRCWTERRLAQARALYDSARKAGLAVGIELLEELSKRLEARDTYTYGHNQRVARHAERIARAMRLPAAEIAKVRTAATVHDIGKLYTPREILNNPGRLTDREYAIVKLHAGDGADMLTGVGDPEIATMVRHHHERIDGHGYPDGLSGSDIPLGARIIAVADTFDAITSNRPYQQVGTHKKALDILSQQAGAQLDGTAVTVFLSRYSARRSIAWFALAAAVPQRIFAALQAVSPSIGASAGAITSILPALGAAGLLTLSSGLRHDTAIERGTPRRPAVTQAQQLAGSATPATAARHHARRTTSTQPTRRPGHHRTTTHRTIRIPARTPRGIPLSKSPKASTPSTSTTTGASPREHGGVVSAAPTTSSQAPTPATPLPTLPVPSVKEAPALPALPISPPVTLPSVPPVSLPSVSLPPVSLPSVSLPSISISTTEALAPKHP
jgi:putative nucleotidyltransferase with HDIG domain